MPENDLINPLYFTGDPEAKGREKTCSQSGTAKEKGHLQLKRCFSCCLVCFRVLRPGHPRGARKCLPHNGLTWLQDQRGISSTGSVLRVSGGALTRVRKGPEDQRGAARVCATLEPRASFACVHSASDSRRDRAPNRLQILL